jgi:hypothetical protein
MKKSVVLLATLACQLFGAQVFAQGVDEFGAYGGLERRGKNRSAQEAAFEFRVGPYRPHVDDDLTGTPYEDTFGNDTRWHAGIEVDWQLLRLPDTLSFGPGIGIAYTHASAEAPLASGNGLSAQQTTLGIVPFHLVGVLRLDAIADRTMVPLVPYAKLGLGYALWWSSIGEKASRVDGEVARGASYGLVYALGVVFRLDPLDPGSAASADASLGINHSGVFIEWFNSSLDGFGSGKMQVGTSTWVVGLNLEI